PGERTRDYPTDSVWITNAPRDAADFVEALERHHVFVRGDLEHGIGGGVENRPAGLAMLRAELIQNHRAALRVVADEFHLRLRLDRLDETRRKFFIDCERLVEN